MSLASVRPPEPPPPPATAQMKAALRGFIETAPLYQKVRMAVAPDAATMIPDSAEGYCPICKQLRVFSSDFYKDREARVKQGIIVRSDRVHTPPDQWGHRWNMAAFASSGIHTFVGLCSSCKQFTFSSFILIDASEQWVQKVGQNPAPWMKPVRPEIQQALGDDYRLFQRATALIGEGFGMGACAYLRRLLEDQIDPLLERLKTVEQARGASVERVMEIVEVQSGRDFAAKARAVTEVLPSVLQTPGVNPLITLHSGYSAGMHGWSEEDCLAVAELSVEALTQIIVNLSDQPQKHREYVEALKALEKMRADGKT